jgi:hypothetical protein
MTDVWTSVGVIVGVAAVAITGWERLDALVALAVAVNIVVTGSGLVRRSVGGLMDRALGEPERRQNDEVLDRFRARGLEFHAVRSRQAGSRAIMSVHVLVPGDWTVRRGHDVAEEVEAELRERRPYATVFTYLEPAEDPRSFDDTALDRPSRARSAPSTGSGTRRGWRARPNNRSRACAPTAARPAGGRMAAPRTEGRLLTALVCAPGVPGSARGAANRAAESVTTRGLPWRP